MRGNASEEEVIQCLNLTLFCMCPQALERLWFVKWLRFVGLATATYGLRPRKAIGAAAPFLPLRFSWPVQQSSLGALQAAWLVGWLGRWVGGSLSGSLAGKLVRKVDPINRV